MSGTPIDMPANPDDPSTFKASNGVTYMWDGVKWSATSSDTPAGEGITVSDTNPSNPSEGNLWYNTVDGILYVWYVDESQNASLGQGQWVDIRPGNDSDDA